MQKELRTHQPLLIVEDSPEDFETVVFAFEQSGLVNPIHHAKSGDDALDYLLRRGPYANRSDVRRPGVILLDLNLPGTDGREVLTVIKQHPDLQKIPVIVLTTSADARDIDACYRAGANSYVQKPVDFKGFMAAIQRLKEYWFSIAILPKVDP